MTSTINERHVLSTVHLSDAQRMVLVKAFGSPTPQVAYEESTTDRNVAGAKDTLRKLGLINVDENEGTIAVTAEGQKVLEDEDLVDRSGQMTDTGKKYFDAKDINDTKSDDPENEPEGNLANPEQEDPNAPMESFNLIRQLNDVSKLNS